MKHDVLQQQVYSAKARRTRWTRSHAPAGTTRAYTDWHNEELPSRPRRRTIGCPSTRHIGGIESMTGDLLYSRFYTKVLRDLGLLEFGRAVRTRCARHEKDEQRRDDVEAEGATAIAPEDMDRRVRPTPRAPAIPFATSRPTP